jgi:hypothetical protein
MTEPDVVAALEQLREADRLLDAAERSRLRTLDDAAFERRPRRHAMVAESVVHLHHERRDEDLAVTSHRQLREAAEHVREAARCLASDPAAQVLARASMLATQPSATAKTSELVDGIQTLQRVVRPSFDDLRREHDLEQTVAALTDWHRLDAEDQRALTVAGVGSLRPGIAVAVVVVGIAIVHTLMTGC